MSIKPETLEKQSKKYIVVNSTQTIADVSKCAAASNYPSEDTWVVIVQYQVIPLTELPDDPAQSLAELDVPPATWVVPMDTPKSTRDILNQVNNKPGSTMVIIDDQGVVGLLAGSRRTIGERPPAGQPSQTGSSQGEQQFPSLPHEVCANPRCNLPVKNFSPPVNHIYTCPIPTCARKYSLPKLPSKVCWKCNEPVEKFGDSVNQIYTCPKCQWEYRA